MKNAITVSFSITTDEEIRETEIFQLERRTKNRRLALLIFGICAAVVAVCELLIAHGGAEPYVRSIYAFAAGILLGHLKLALRKIEMLQFDDDSTVDTDVTFDPDGITYRCMYFEEHDMESEIYPFDKVTLCAEYPDALYIETKHEHFTLPSRAFSEDTARAVTELLREKCGKRYVCRGALSLTNDDVITTPFFD